MPRHTKLGRPLEEVELRKGDLAVSRGCFAEERLVVRLERRLVDVHDAMLASAHVCVMYQVSARGKIYMGHGEKRDKWEKKRENKNRKLELT